MTKTVASIYYEERRAERTLYGGNYHMPAVPRGAKPALLQVTDKTQLERMPHIVGGGLIPRHIAGEEIANDIVKHWTEGVLGMTGNVGPGIWIVRDVIPILDENGIPVMDALKIVQTRPATEAEKAAMWAEDLAEAVAKQARWGEYNIQQGDALANDQNTKMRLLIGPTMKASCKYYGREREWMDELKDGDVKSCVFCFKSVDRRVLVCPHCQNVVDRAAYDKLTAKPLAPAQRIGA